MCVLYVILEQSVTRVSLFLFVEQVIAGLDRAAATMKKGECAILTITPEYGFGSGEVKRDLAVVPPFSKIIYEVEMLDFMKVISTVLEVQTRIPDVMIVATISFWANKLLVVFPHVRKRIILKKKLLGLRFLLIATNSWGL